MARPSPDPAVRASRPLPAAPEYLRNNCARRSGEFEAEGRLEAQIAYGFALAQSRSVLTPYGGFTLGNAGSRTMRGGARWTFGADVATTLEATRSKNQAGEAANEVRLGAAPRF